MLLVSFVSLADRKNMKGVYRNEEIANQSLVSDFLYSRWDYVNFHVVSICFGVESVFQLITEIINRNEFV